MQRNDECMMIAASSSPESDDCANSCALQVQPSCVMTGIQSHCEQPQKAIAQRQAVAAATNFTYHDIDCSGCVLKREHWSSIDCSRVCFLCLSPCCQLGNAVTCFTARPVIMQLSAALPCAGQLLGKRCYLKDLVKQDPFYCTWLRQHIAGCEAKVSGLLRQANATSTKA